MADSHNKCLIVGPSNLYLPLLVQLKKTASHVIAVDGGGNGIYKSGFKPDYMIGDWDSISQEAKEYFMSQEIPSQTFPVEKDLSDLEIAIQYAWRKGHRNFIFTGFLGGRISHELFNIEVLKKLKKRGCRVSLRERKARLEFLQA
ncbi:MAG: thiamine diphosphokinase, partial [Tissierellia bacterium]|nr:thiamine diphosphokinase [Tissierellia bacterium]